MLKRYADLILLCRIHNRPQSFRSMYDARHLGQLPLPLGEGWGEGLMD